VPTDAVRRNLSKTIYLKEAPGSLPLCFGSLRHSLEQELSWELLLTFREQLSREELLLFYLLSDSFGYVVQMN
jgi:hypothetical protein